MVLAALLLGSLLPGCSSQGAFELLRGFHLNQCRRLPPAEQPRCIEGVPSDYEQYKAERARRQIQ